MTRIRNEKPILAQYIENLVRGSVPEQLDKINGRWKKYEPEFFIAADGPDALCSPQTENTSSLIERSSLYTGCFRSPDAKVLKYYSSAVCVSLPAENLSSNSGFHPNLVCKSFPPSRTITNVPEGDNRQPL